MVRVVDRRKAIAALLLLRIRRRRNRQRWWIHPMNRTRKTFEAYYHLVVELQLDSEKHQNYFRMSVVQMEEILSIVGPDLTRQTTNFRDPIEPKQRLAISLRYLAAGESFTGLAYQYRVGAMTVCSSVHMTCSAIEKTMMATHIPPPPEDQWKASASKFWNKRKFPNCLGAIDGKHITIKAPPNSGSLFFNYKKTFSIVLLALVDADYRFTYIQVGDIVRASDGGCTPLQGLAEAWRPKHRMCPKTPLYQVQVCRVPRLTSLSEMRHFL